jgi:hypothetical protein
MLHPPRLVNTFHASVLLPDAYKARNIRVTTAENVIAFSFTSLLYDKFGIYLLPSRAKRRF